MSSLEERKVQADRILDSVAGVPPQTLRLVGRALVLGGGPVAGFGDGLAYHADTLEHGGDGWLARLKVAYELAELERDSGDLLERLEEADEPPWPALREALVGDGAAHKSVIWRNSP